MNRPVPSERGSATVLVLGGVTVVLLALVAALALVSAVLGSHRARSSADLAALAAATAARDGSPDNACGFAARVARVNGATLSGCRFESDGSATVSVTVPTWTGSAVARARAGPARPTDLLLSAQESFGRVA